MKSPNFNDRRGQTDPDMIVLHYTEMDSAQEALERLCDPRAEVSSHYLIDEEGNVFQLVDEKKRAWHAGKSCWDGRDDVNSRSVGIEISNKPPRPFTPEQILAAITLCRDLCDRYNIRPRNVVGHSDIAPARKQDPGPLFPWRTLAEAGVGHWPQPQTGLGDFLRAFVTARQPLKVKALLKQAGWPVDGFGPENPPLKDVIRAFQTRFEPQGLQNGRATARTVLLLQALAKAQD